MKDDECAITAKSAPGLIEEKERIGKLAFGASEFPVAVQAYQECLIFLKWLPRKERDKEAPRYMTNIASARFGMRDYELSLGDADRALIVDRTYVKAHYRRGKALAALRRPVEALSAFLDALDLDEGNKVLQKEVYRLDKTLTPDQQYAARAARAAAAAEAAGPLREGEGAGVREAAKDGARPRGEPIARRTRPG